MNIGCKYAMCTECRQSEQFCKECERVMCEPVLETGVYKRTKRSVTERCTYFDDLESCMFVSLVLKR